MSTFDVKVVRIDEIKNHPNADRLDLARVGGYQCIVGKRTYDSGDLAVYIPEAAIVPADVCATLGLLEKLAGKNKDRVKAVRLRGIVSQGLLHPLGVGRLAGMTKLSEGDDVIDILGIKKYEPPIPVSMSGQVKKCLWGTRGFDVENFKRYPDLIPAGTRVQLTEKLHGTFCGICYDPENGWAVFSKGLGSQHLAFKLDDKENQLKNLYVKTFYAVKDKLEAVVEKKGESKLFIFGEIFGQGVQDLHYGVKPDLAIFDINEDDEWLDPKTVKAIADDVGLRTVPVVYEGPFNPDSGHQAGQTLLDADHIREGVVVRPLHPYRCEETGMRAMVKMVSDDYLFRKGGTEFN